MTWSKNKTRIVKSVILRSARCLASNESDIFSTTVFLSGFLLPMSNNIDDL